MASPTELAAAIHNQADIAVLTAKPFMALEPQTLYTLSKPSIPSLQAHGIVICVECFAYVDSCLGYLRLPRFPLGSPLN